MKNYITTSIIMAASTLSVLAQPNNIHLHPASGNVCNVTTLSVGIHGNSFAPESYIWSTGEISAEIEINTSGTYTVTVTGFMGNSSHLTTIVCSETYNVLPSPNINALTDLWICKGDTVKLMAVAGYDEITWSNGATGQLFEQRLNLNTPGTPGLDTMTVSYTATVDKVCTTKSKSVLLRAIRKPDGVGAFYQGKMNIKTTDSIPAGLVTEYLFPVTYEMDFIEIANPTNVIKYVTAPGSRKAPASILTPGASYSVVTTPVINGKQFCSGIPSIIGIKPVGNRLGLGFTDEEGVSTFKVYDTQGRFLMEKQGEVFNMEWLQNLAPQMLIVYREGQSTEVTKIQIVK